MPALNDTMFARPPVFVRRADLSELWRIAADAQRSAPGAQLFLEEFERLSIAPEGQEGFVRLGTTVVYKDLRTKRQRRVRLVRPGQVNAEENEISLLSPIGGALVGLSEGSIFRWMGFDGQLRAIKVLEVTHDEEKSRAG